MHFLHVAEDRVDGKLLHHLAILLDPLPTFMRWQFGEIDYMVRAGEHAIDERTLFESPLAAGAREVVALILQLLLGSSVASGRKVGAAFGLCVQCSCGLAQFLAMLRLSLRWRHRSSIEGRSTAFCSVHFVTPFRDIGIFVTVT